MDYAAYMREQAANYRMLAWEEDDIASRQDLLDLAETCEQEACRIEDCAAGG